MLKVKFVSLEGASLDISGESLVECLKLQKSEKFNQFSPLVIVAQSGTLFYYDDNLVNSLLSEEINLKEFTSQTKCNALWRNVVELKDNWNNIIEIGYLWKQVDNKLYIIDDDRYIESFINEKAFEKYEF